MRSRKLSKQGTKAKIGTILDTRIVEKLKTRAVRERKPISAVIEEAILFSESAGLIDRELRLKALEAFLSVRFNLTDAQWNAVLEEDIYEP